MTERVPTLKARDLIRVLRRIGFIQTRSKGSHFIFKHPDGRMTSVPVHSGEDIGRGLLYDILEDVRLKAEELRELL